MMKRTRLAFAWTRPTRTFTQPSSVSISRSASGSERLLRPNGIICLSAPAAPEAATSPAPTPAATGPTATSGTTTAAVRRSKPRVLVNEPVLLQSAPEKHGPGVPFFCDLFDKRVRDLGSKDLCPRPLLEELAYRSGGRARDFITFIRSLADVAWDESAPAATEAIVRKVLREERLQREMGLHKGHIELLQGVADDPSHALPESPLAQELLNYQTLLPYPNESEWYYPHPLLLMHLIRVGAAPASGSMASGASSGSTAPGS